MDNTYWQIYSELEKELENIMYTISFVREHRKVYSPRIAELIVRCGMQIESTIQSLYAQEHKNTSSKINYKTCIEFLNKKWDFSERYVIIQTDKIKSANNNAMFIPPFSQLVDKVATINGKKHYCPKNSPNSFNVNVAKGQRCKAYVWENAYNNLKHNFYNSIEEYGNIFNLILIMSTLYLLNIYWDPGLELTNIYNGISVMKHTDITKSKVFSVLFLDCFVDNGSMILDYPHKNITSFGNYSFLNIQNIGLFRNKVHELLGDNWEEVTDDYTKYKVPKEITQLLPLLESLNNYNYIVRNQLKSSSLTTIQPAKHS